MPTLSDNAKEAYIKAYGEPMYRRYCDGPDTFHGSSRPPDPDDLSSFEFCHRPDHDVESIFWVLLATLLRAQPLSRTKKVDFQRFLEADALFRDHVIQKGARIDSRDNLLTFTQADMQEALDPKLASLSRMLAKMAAQIRPEYGYLSPPPRKDHLHEAMRRLLLEQLVGMTDDIKLDPGVSRPLSPDEDQLTGTKRKSRRKGGVKTKRIKL